jgi:hypothetical protein
MAGKAVSITYAGVAAVFALLISFWTFRWGFIRLWEWQHHGRLIIFAYWPETKAGALALLLSICVFAFVFRLSRRSRIRLDQ